MKRTINNLRNNKNSKTRKIREIRETRENVLNGLNEFQFNVGTIPNTPLIQTQRPTQPPTIHRIAKNRKHSPILLSTPVRRSIKLNITPQLINVELSIYKILDKPLYVKTEINLNDEETLTQIERLHSQTLPLTKFYYPVKNNGEVEFWSNLPEFGSKLRAPFNFETELIQFRELFEPTGLYTWQDMGYNNSIILFMDLHGNMKMKPYTQSVDIQNALEIVEIPQNISYLKKISLSQMGQLGYFIRLEGKDEIDLQNSYMDDVKRYLKDQKYDIRNINLDHLKFIRGRYSEFAHHPQTPIMRKSMRTRSMSKKLANNLKTYSSYRPEMNRQLYLLNSNNDKGVKNNNTRRKSRMIYDLFYLQSHNRNKDYEYVKNGRNNILFDKEYSYKLKDINRHPQTIGVNIFKCNGFFSGYDKLPEALLMNKTLKYERRNSSIQTNEPVIAQQPIQHSTSPNLENIGNLGNFGNFNNLGNIGNIGNFGDLLNFNRKPKNLRRMNSNNEDNESNEHNESNENNKHLVNNILNVKPRYTLYDPYYGQKEFNEDWNVLENEILFSTQSLLDLLSNMGYSQILIIDDSCSPISTSFTNNNLGSKSNKDENFRKSYYDLLEHSLGQTTFF
jgi:hypothetical protein